MEFDPSAVNIAPAEEAPEIKELKEKNQELHKKNQALSHENAKLKKEIEKIPDFDYRGKLMLIRSGNYKLIRFPMKQVMNFFLIFIFIGVLAWAAYYSTTHTEQTGFDKGANYSIGTIYTKCFYLPQKACFDTSWDSTMCLIPGNETCRIVQAVRRK